MIFKSIFFFFLSFFWEGGGVGCVTLFSLCCDYFVLIW